MELPCQRSFLAVFFIFFLVCLLSAAQHHAPAVVWILAFTVCIRVLVLYTFKITQISFFLFFVGIDNVYFFFSSLGSSLICLPFPAVFCLTVVSVHVTWAVICLYRRVQPPSFW